MKKQTIIGLVSAAGIGAAAAAAAAAIIAVKKAQTPAEPELDSTIPVDLNGDGTVDAVLLDTDGDGVVDTVVTDTDQTGTVNTVITDLDGDGNDEVIITGNPDLIDTQDEDITVEVFEVPDDSETAESAAENAVCGETPAEDGPDASFNESESVTF